MEKCMNQEAFIRDFQEALAGKVSDHIIRENTDYYKNYINMQMRQGVQEAEVLQSLGDPRLLAKTVVESQRFSNEGQATNAEYQGGTKTQGEYYSGEIQERKFGNIPTWLIVIVGVIILLAVLRLAFSVLRFLAPFIITGAVILFAIKVLKNIFGS